MRKISVFENFIKELGSQSLAQIIKEIKGKRHKAAVLKIRKLVSIGDQEKADQLKKELVTFTVSGLFEGGPRMVFLKTYNPFVILDINNLDPHSLRFLVFKLKHIDFTKAVFVSPGGRGLKIIVQVDSKMKMHDQACHQVRDFYERRLSVAIEKNGNNISRLCFMSYDPEAYFNPKSTVYKIAVPRIKKGKSLSKKIMDATSGKSLKVVDKGSDIPVDYPQIFANCVIEANAKLVYGQGNRSNYIYQLGIISNAAGIPLKVAIAETNKGFDLSESAIEETISSAYNWKPFESVKKLREDPIELPPLIPSKVYDKLPALLKEGSSPYKDRHQERDAFLTGALGVLSGLLTGVRGVYDREICYPNLFVFVVAPPASGKGAFKLARYLGTAYGNKLSNANDKKREDYKEAVKKFKVDSLKFEKGDLAEAPQAPKRPDFKRLFIPTNINPVNLNTYLNQNERPGILFESNAGYLGDTMNRYEDEHTGLLSKVFHHKSMAAIQKSSEELTKVSHPKLSLSLSGTPHQITKFVPSFKDGLLSTFMFYAFESEGAWRDVSPNGFGVDLQGFYENLSEDVLEIIHFMEAYPVEFKLTKAQWKILNSTFKKMMKETKQKFGAEPLMMVRRMGMNCFRIAMILSAIRKFQEKDLGTELVCSTDDFEVAIWLTETYLKHGLFIYKNLPVSPATRFSFKNVRA